VSVVTDRCKYVWILYWIDYIICIVGLYIILWVYMTVECRFLQVEHSAPYGDCF
jgi:hypothetical protein